MSANTTKVKEMWRHYCDYSTGVILKPSIKQPTKVTKIEYWHKSSPENKCPGILKTISGDKPGRRMFVNAMNNWEKIKNNNIPYCKSYIDHIEWKEYIFEWNTFSQGSLLFEYIPGGDLDNWLKIHSNNITKQHIVSVINQLMTFVNRIHVLDFAHRDIAPNNILMPNDDENILLSPDDIEISIIDLSSGSMEREGIVTSSCFTQDKYQAPGTTKGSKWDNKMDIYSCGAILKHMTDECKICDDVLKKLITIMTAIQSKDRPSAQKVLEILKTNFPSLNKKIDKNKQKKSISGKKRKQFDCDNPIHEMKIHSEPPPKKLKTNQNDTINICHKNAQSAPPTVTLKASEVDLLQLFDLNESKMKFKMNRFDDLLKFYKERVKHQLLRGQKSKGEGELAEGTIKTVGFVYFFYKGSVEEAETLLVSIMPLNHNQMLSGTRYKYIYRYPNNTKRAIRVNGLKQVLERIPKDTFEFKCPNKGCDKSFKVFNIAVKHIGECDSS